MSKPAIAYDPPFARNYAREMLALSHGRGSWLWDTNGNRYLDFGSGIAVNALGYGDRRLARTVARQMRRLVHVSNLYATMPSIEFGARLLAAAKDVGRAPFSAVHFGNSGTEANEAAIKYARLYALATRGVGHHTILSFQNAFHGRTMGALSATPKQSYRAKFEPLLPGFATVPFEDPAALETALTDEVAAVMVEVVQGEGGLSVISPEVVEVLNRVCPERGILVVADEIQTGLGRLGTLFGSESVGLKPDVITLSKPLGGGLPLSATLLPAAVNDHIAPGDHGSTFGGGPATTAAGLHVWNRLTRDGFLERVRQRGRELDGGLERLRDRFPWIVELRGLGMLRGLRVDLGVDQAALFGEIVQEARSRGLLILRSGTDVVRVAPPLTISTRELHTGLARLEQTFQSINARRTV